MDEILLRVVGLKTHFFVKRGIVKAVDGVSFFLERGEILGIVGESGCGKSVTSLSILRLIQNPPGKIVGGRIFFEGEDILSISEESMRKIRGKKITMIQQNPDSSLNPVFRVGSQVVEAIAKHERLNKKSLWKNMVDMLRMVRIASPEIRAFDFPHQMSGGMRQRIAGAIALSCNANLLIADEPTTNLDVTTQMEYLKLLKEIQSKTNIGIIFITHDFGIVSRICNRVAVMYAGRIVETGSTDDIMNDPMHPYTAALLDSVPHPDLKRKRLHSIEGQPPDMANLPPGCSFAERCIKATDICRHGYLEESMMSQNHTVSCHHAG